MKKQVKAIMIILLVMAIIAVLVIWLADENTLKTIANTLVNFVSNEIVGKSIDLFN